MIMGLGGVWINFHLLMVEGLQKKPGEEYWAEFWFSPMGFPKLHQPTLDRQRTESHLKLAIYQTRYLGLEMSFLQHCVAD